jgi:hypothetical protein
MVIQLQLKSGLLHWVIVFLKDETINLTIITTTMHSIINCESLQIFKVYGGTCFGHMMCKAYQ